ncbi:hypothetical protein WUBG_15906 [Wuchereria bancrofti]|uniref:Uncharacterized protein n=1 Tax=Wuchereria bancrofti TaxID=6293 RepID=J9E887_WUCBA|nr:hypothetical protein WUBG_15906 [Wuchereria bancrofti]
MIIKKADGNLIAAPCKSKELTIEDIKAHSLWEEISEQKELAEQLGSEFNETVRPIQKSVITHWRLITICISIVTISIVLIALN